MGYSEAVNHYNLVEQAIAYLVARADSQPSLEEAAAHVGVSPHYFQRIFQQWAGVSPKKFLQFITLVKAKQLLLQNQTVLSAATEVGLSSPSRLHDLFVAIEGMTPGEYKSGGSGLAIRYCFAETCYGSIIVASTAKGVCFLAFCTDEREGLVRLQRQFPRAMFERGTDELQQAVIDSFTDLEKRPLIKLHLNGTPFQLAVWQALLRIPVGSLSTYSAVAQELNKQTASRAVGTAVGANPVPYIIPCHRVIRATGALGGYSAGLPRKYALLFRELNRDGI